MTETAAEAPTLEDLDRLDSLTNAMHETLRRYPPLSTIPRIPTEDIAYEGFEIPAGSMVAAYPLHTHHMAEWWSDPYGFDPDRFFSCC